MPWRYFRNPINENRLVGLLVMAVWDNSNISEAQQARFLAIKHLNEANLIDLPSIKIAFKKAVATSSNQIDAFQKLVDIWKNIPNPNFLNISFAELISSQTFHEQKRSHPTYGSEIPPWQTDSRSTYNEIPEYAGFANLNYCLRAIYQKSLELGGELQRVTFWAFDGAFNRGVFTAFCSEAALHFGAEVMEKWNSTGASPYATKAVLATFSNIQTKALLLRILHKNLIKKLWIQYESFNRNPWNDEDFTNKIRHIIKTAEELPSTKRKWQKCKICGEDSRGKPLCRRHYLKSIGEKYVEYCQYPGCKEPSKGKPLCRKHYYGSK